MKNKISRPIKGKKVKWKTFNVLVHTVRIRDKTAKIVQDFKSNKTMPYQYFWVDFNEIGY